MFFFCFYTVFLNLAAHGVIRGSFTEQEYTLLAEVTQSAPIPPSEKPARLSVFGRHEPLLIPRQIAQRILNIDEYGFPLERIFGGNREVTCLPDKEHPRIHFKKGGTHVVELTPAKEMTMGCFFRCVLGGGVTSSCLMKLENVWIQKPCPEIIEQELIARHGPNCNQIRPGKTTEDDRLRRARKLLKNYKDALFDEVVRSGFREHARGQDSDVLDDVLYRTQAPDEEHTCFLLQASPSVPGPHLSEFLDAHPTEDGIQIENFSRLFIGSLLSLPADYHGHNIKVDDSTGHLVGIDNDEFWDALFFREEGRLGLQMKNILFCMPASMNISIPPDVTQHLFQPPAMLILTWLKEMDLACQEFERMRSAGILTSGTPERPGEYENLKLPLRLPTGMLPFAYRTLQHIQAVLRDNPNATHWQLLQRVHPLFFEIYKHFAQEYPAHPRAMWRAIYGDRVQAQRMPSPNLAGLSICDRLLSEWIDENTTQLPALQNFQESLQEILTVFRQDQIPLFDLAMDGDLSDVINFLVHRLSLRGPISCIKALPFYIRKRAGFLATQPATSWQESELYRAFQILQDHQKDLQWEIALNLLLPPLRPPTIQTIFRGAFSGERFLTEEMLREGKQALDRTLVFPSYAKGHKLVLKFAPPHPGMEIIARAFFRHFVPRNADFFVPFAELFSVEEGSPAIGLPVPTVLAVQENETENFWPYLANKQMVEALLSFLMFGSPSHGFQNALEASHRSIPPDIRALLLEKLTPLMSQEMPSFWEQWLGEVRKVHEHHTRLFDPISPLVVTSACPQFVGVSFPEGTLEGLLQQMTTLLLLLKDNPQITPGDVLFWLSLERRLRRPTITQAGINQGPREAAHTVFTNREAFFKEASELAKIAQNQPSPLVSQLLKKPLNFHLHRVQDPAHGLRLLTSSEQCHILQVAMDRDDLSELCIAHTDQLLNDLLGQAPFLGRLTTLVLENTPSLDQNILTTLADRCGSLAQLRVATLPWTHFSHMRNPIIAFSSLQQLTLKNLPRLKQIALSASNLQDLAIIHCPALVKLIGNGSPYLQSFLLHGKTKLRLRESPYVDRTPSFVDFLAVQEGELERITLSPALSPGPGSPQEKEIDYLHRLKHPRLFQAIQSLPPTVQEPLVQGYENGTGLGSLFTEDRRMVSAEIPALVEMLKIGKPCGILRFDSCHITTFLAALTQSGAEPRVVLGRNLNTREIQSMIQEKPWISFEQ